MQEEHVDGPSSGPFSIWRSFALMTDFATCLLGLLASQPRTSHSDCMPVSVCCGPHVCPSLQAGQLQLRNNQLSQEKSILQQEKSTQQQELADAAAPATTLQEELSNVCLFRMEGGRGCSALASLALYLVNPTVATSAQLRVCLQVLKAGTLSLEAGICLVDGCF